MANTNNEVISNLKVKRGVVQGQLTKMKKFMETPGRSLLRSELQTRLGLLEEFWCKFDDLQTKLECLAEEEQNGDRREVVQDTFIMVKSKILELMGPEPTASRSSLAIPDAPPNKKNVRLPKLSIKKFSGSYIAWPDFYAKFKTLIEDNEELTDIEKMAYLQESLEEMPLRLISNLSLANDFSNAIATLKSRYENKRLIFQGHIREIVEIKAVERPSEIDLRSLVDTVQSSLRALKNLATQKEVLEGLLLHIIRGKIDTNSRMKWEEEIPNGTYSSWDEFVSYIERRCRVLENSNASKGMSSTLSAKISGLIPGKGKHRRSLLVTKTDRICGLCKQVHAIENCEKFSTLPPPERFQVVKSMKLCILCLKAGHTVKYCNSARCEVCNRRHHTLLHLGEVNRDLEGRPIVSSPADSKCSHAGITMTSHSSGPSKDMPSEVFLATAVVLIKACRGDYIPCRVLLDSGSSLNLIAERMVQRLQMKKVRADVRIGGIGSTTLPVKYKTDVTIKSRLNDYCTAFEAYILPKITEHQPCQRAAVNWTVPENITLADPGYNTPQPIDLLIGANLFFELLFVGQIKLGDGLPILQKTVFGWIVSGGKRYSGGNVHHATWAESGGHPTLDKLESLVQQFWAIDNPHVKEKLLSPEQQACEEHFVKNVWRDETGRFSVKLPFRKAPRQLGSSLCIAKRRFFNMEHKLTKAPERKRQYSDFILEYLSLGHMERVSLQDVPQGHYFMPHHCVLKPESSSTKLRVVFDASCKTTSGLSLNDTLMVGPVVQDDLHTLLIRFRSHKYALTADVSKMYRQIVVRSPDRNYQYILWRNDLQAPLEAYRLCTLTYGTAPASFIATRCLKQLALEGRDSFPLGSSVVENDFYVDDMITGADSITEAMAIQTQVTELLRSGCFPLAKWCSNASELLQEIDENCREKYLSINGNDVVKTLGMIWRPSQDEFRYTYASQECKIARVTKRTVLSSIARLFDPIGLLSPIITKAKIFLQELWRLKLDWDESLPLHLHQQWCAFFVQLEAVKEVKVPRYILHRSSRIEVHGFADASMDAYGCCIYVRCESVDSVCCNLLTARSRVSPLQTQSIARLELCAALLLSETIRRIADMFEYHISKVYYWSDSSNVLAWLASSPSRWSVFVGNRVSKIQDMSKNFRWRHIGGENNPADIVSRGAFPLDVINCSLWFHGPRFLLLSKENWPKSHINDRYEAPEERKQRVILTVSSSSSFIESHKFINSYQKMVNVVAYIIRFANNARTKDCGNRVCGMLSLEETDYALLAIIRTLQKELLSDDYSKLIAAKAVSQKSALKNLDPFVDSFGLIRVGGRLSNSVLEHDQKHPILLPKSNFTKALIYFHHYRNLHVGCQTLLAIIRSRFWPLGGRATIKSAILGCIRCFRCRPKIAEQIMGQLPSSRVQPNPIFFNTGVDFCGPFYLKSPVRNRPPTKAYICIFICMAIKAVHLEVVGDLSTEAFLSALTKFIARRPFVAKIYSDNATNFIGARRELKELKALFESQIQSQLIQEICKNDGIKWETIPVRSPNFGGLWESAVKQAKHLLKRAFGNAVLTLDELQRVACQTESILNSRPITPISNDPNDLEILTPGHFLAGGMMRAIPSPKLEEININRLDRWQLMQSKIEVLWSRWSKDYLQGLQIRNKWNVKKPNLRTGLMVLLKDDNIPTLKWPLGRIVKVQRRGRISSGGLGADSCRGHY